MEFSPAEKLIATAAGDCTVRVWSTASLACVATLQGHAAPVLCVRFLDDGHNGQVT